ncbi:ATP-binding protein [Uliginosibacterium sp. H3]|uniref:ATP-binding protein n=1 Tax=Uliginosibacterium silvisoli TaxID=3114758 RepID=A0ABU6JZR7_9RHOO|nr:ATP-binding protein [Uliginosibacterium sp. H3]
MRHDYTLEVMRPACHVSFDVTEASQVGEVRRAAVRIAEGLDFDESAAGRVALVVTELGNNLVRHAQRGRLLVAAVTNDSGAMVVEILSLDHGPGIANTLMCMTDGYSTGGTPGTGLGAVQRLSDEFDVFSRTAAGTVILSRVAARLTHVSGAAPGDSATPSAFSVAGVALAAPGEIVCGDAWSVVRHDDRAALLVADGLGHGPYAAEASVAATDVFERMPFAGPSGVIEKVHEGLRATRGAAVAMADIDSNDEVVLFSGAGNIVGRLISGIEDRSLMSQHGTAGMQIGRLQDVRYEWPSHAILVMHSDGLTTRWKLEDAVEILQHHPALIAGWLIRDHCRGRDDATVVVLKRRTA